MKPVTTKLILDGSPMLRTQFRAEMLFSGISLSQWCANSSIRSQAMSNLWLTTREFTELATIPRQVANHLFCKIQSGEKSIWYE